MKEGTTGLHKEASDCLVWFVFWSVEPVLCVFVGRSFLPSMFRRTNASLFVWGNATGACFALRTHDRRRLRNGFGFRSRTRLVLIYRILNMWWCIMLNRINVKCKSLSSLSIIYSYIYVWHDTATEVMFMIMVYKNRFVFVLFLGSRFGSFVFPTHNRLPNDCTPSACFSARILAAPRPPFSNTC